MDELYSLQGLNRWSGRARRYRRIALGIGLVTLAVCVLLCTRVETATALTLRWTVIGLSILGGWTVILLLMLGYAPAKAEMEHWSGVMRGEGEIAEGILTLDRQKWVIPHSVAFYRVRLANEKGSREVSVNVHLASRLPENGTRVRVRLTRRFITACEVLHEV